MAPSLTSICSLGTAALLCASVNLGGGEDSSRSESAPPQANTAVSEQPAAPLHPDEGEKVRVSKSRDGLFYVSAKVNGTPVLFLVDTGANLVVLTPEDARRVGAASSGGRGHGEIETAGGTSRMDRVTLDSVQIAGNEMEDVDAAVMHQGLRVSLMGQNMLAKLGPILLTGNELSLQKRK